MKKNAAVTGLLFLLISLQILQAPLYAETPGTGIIKAIKPLGNGVFEITVELAGKESPFLVNDTTEIQSQTSAEKIKPGTRIYMPSPKGVKNALANISPLLRKELNLPDVPKIPELPQMPQLPDKAAMQKPAKLPLKKTNGKKSEAPEEAPAPAMAGGSEGGGEGGEAPRQKPREEEPNPEDKALFGRVDADQSLVENKGEVDEGLVAEKVMKVEKISGGIKLKLESGQETVVAPAKKIFQRLSPADLQEKMKIKIVPPGSGNELRKVTVLS